MTDTTNWVTVKVPDDDHDRASDYKPDGVTWGDCLVAGAERLNDAMDSDDRHYLPGPSTFAAEAEISVSIPDEDLDRIREDVAAAIDEGAGLGPVTLEAAERQRIAAEVVEVLRE